MGEDEKKIVEQCVRARMPFPERIANAPSLQLGLGLYYVAFLDLTSCRSIGYGPGPIPYLTIAQYCDVHELYDELREDVLYHVTRLDKVYLDWSHEKTKKAAASTKTPSRGRRR